MTDPSFHIQASLTSVPSTPSWFGEVAVVAHAFKQFGLSKAIEEVRFVRARMGKYEMIDFVAMLIGYAVSGERTLGAFSQRVRPFAEAFMALFGRSELPDPVTLSRYLAVLDQPCVEALRTLFLEDLLARFPFGTPPGGLWDRLGNQWMIIDVDGTRQAARQRALPSTPELPPAHRRFEQVCAPGHLGRKRGEVVRTRTTVLQAHTHQWLGTFGNPGNGQYPSELQQARCVIATYAAAVALPLSHVVIRLDGLYGNAAPLADLLADDGPESLASLVIRLAMPWRSPMGTPLARVRVCRSRFLPATRWYLALPRRTDAVCARATTGTQWVAARAVCWSSRLLPPLSSAGTVPGERSEDHPLPTGERSVLAVLFHTTSHGAIRKRDSPGAGFPF